VVNELLVPKELLEELAFWVIDLSFALQNYSNASKLLIWKSFGGDFSDDRSTTRSSPDEMESEQVAPFVEEEERSDYKR
jgi:hypothetical protein